MDHTYFDQTYFTTPAASWQRQYEALRAYLVEGLTAAQVAERFGLVEGYVRLMAHRFRRGELPWQEPSWHPGEPRTPGQDEELRERIAGMRRQNLSPEEIAAQLGQEGVQISARTVSRLLRQAGIPPLTRRSAGQRLQAQWGQASGPQATAVAAARPSREPFKTSLAGLLLLLPVLEELDLEGLAGAAGRHKAKGDQGMAWLRPLLLTKLAGLGGAILTPAHEHFRLVQLAAGTAGTAEPAELARQAWLIAPEMIKSWQNAWTRRRRELWGNLARDHMISLCTRQMGEAEAAGEDEPAADAAFKGEKKLKGVTLALALNTPHVLLEGWVAPGRGELCAALLAEEGPWRTSGRLIVCGAKQLTYEELGRLDGAGMHFIIQRRSGSQLVQDADQRGFWRPVKIIRVPAFKGAEACEMAEPGVTASGRPWRQIAFRAENYEQFFLLTNHPKLTAKELVEHFMDHRGLQKGTLDELKFLHPRLPRQACPIPLSLDLLLTQAAEVAYELLRQRLGRDQQQASASWLFTKWIQRNGEIIPEEEGCRLRIARRGQQELTIMQQCLPKWVKLELVAGK